MDIFEKGGLPRLGAAILTWFILFALFSYVGIKLVDLLGLEDTFTYGCYVGLFATLVFIYKHLDLFVLDVSGQEVWVTINQLARKGTPVDDMLAIYFQGLHFIFPWEKLMPEKTVHLVKGQIKLTSDCKEAGKHPTYTTKNKVKLVAKWVVLILPDKDNIANLIKHNMDAIKAVVIGMIDRKLSDLCAKENADDILSKKDWMSTEVANVFEGPNPSATEKAFGIKITDPVLSDLDFEEEERKKMAIVARMKANEQAAVSLVEASRKKDAAGNPVGNPKIKFEEALRAVRVSQGESDEKLIEIVGLENLTGSLMLGAGGGFFPDGSKGDKGGNKGGGKTTK